MRNLAARQPTLRQKYRVEYRTWMNMKVRCHNPRALQYPRYGGAGIKICERWMSFENFISDMGARPEGHSLDRINNDGDYGPTNCRWATDKVQANNKTTTIFGEIQGERMPLSAICEKYGFERVRFSRWIHQSNATIEEAVIHFLNQEPDGERFPRRITLSVSDKIFGMFRLMKARGLDAPGIGRKAVEKAFRAALEEAG